MTTHDAPDTPAAAPETAAPSAGRTTTDRTAASRVAGPGAVPAETAPPVGDAERTRSAVRSALVRARDRTRQLTDCLDDEQLIAQHSPLMSPLVWDLAHIGNQEEIWLVRAAGDRPALRPELDAVYDAFRTPRADRPALEMLSPDEARAFLDEVRRLSFEILADLPLDDEDTLSAHGFLHAMVAQHEQQHDETMLATHQLRRGEPVLHAPPPPDEGSDEPLPPEVLVPGGPFTMGTDTDPWALDNERPAHLVELGPYWLDTAPVTCGAYQEFVDAGGYDDPRWWQPEGWAYVHRAGLRGPLFWRVEEGRTLRRSFGRLEPVEPAEPVLHVCWYEADAYARWAGRRLPTEAEWEKAARHDPAAGRSRRHPWGDEPPQVRHANLGQRHLRPAPAGAYPAGAAPTGARQLLGDMWEWTSSDFTAYPGFRAHPYAEYSEVFFPAADPVPGGSGGVGRYKVLRGGSFGTDEVACRATFRNWDLPIRRQIFAGFRTARDAEPAPRRDPDPRHDPESRRDPESRFRPDPRFRPESRGDSAADERTVS
ncbi:ergothioneine biosynthesis protein EgtB [Streptomyces sp. XM4193]|uniref:ergothioneine biosynthesis protein EgtB n=1 Tax=Streptomyces sp. XM4193 TaxID=2929782 RepID=UPI001FF8A74B|nr:ergothioneine biosynthesis protein EgtB [Streptomyces sp. XM4193]MCK1798348.1 ergothioneine biosynthesis protein EgtB [Streptomyces sp. XM4193]